MATTYWVHAKIYTNYFTCITPLNLHHNQEVSTSIPFLQMKIPSSPKQSFFTIVWKSYEGISSILS